LLTVPEQVDILARAADMPIQSVDVSTEAAIQGLIGIGTPAPVAAAVGQSFEAIRNGQMAFVKDTIKQVTGFESLAWQQAEPPENGRWTVLIAISRVIRQLCARDESI